MSKPLNVLHVTFNMDIGGTEQVIKQLIAGLDATRYNNSVLCIDGYVGPMGQQLIEDGIEVVSLARRSGLDRKLITELGKVSNDRQIDILHCHQYTPFTYGAFAKGLSPARLLFTEHGRFHPERFTWKRRLINQYLQLRADAITSISDATRRALHTYEWIRANRVDVVYNGLAGPDNPSVDLTLRRSLGFSAEHLVMGTVSRLDPIKNQIMMIRAFAQVHKSHPHARLLVVGDGPERAPLEQEVSALDLQHGVVFAGYQNVPGPYLGLMDIFLLSSFSEGTSMTLLEAMARGIPAVVTAVGGNVEILDDNINGLLVASDDTDAYAVAIARLFEEPGLKERIGTAGKHRFDEKFELSNMIEAYEGIYQKLAQL